MRYNLVLTPSDTNVAQTLINLASEVSNGKDLELGYLLRDAATPSLPHISIIQFELAEATEEFLDTLWNTATTLWQEALSQHANEAAAVVSNLQIHYKHDVVGEFAGVSWAEILLSTSENPNLSLLQDALLEKLTPLGVQCLNRHGDDYNPHFTLFNFKTASKPEIILPTVVPTHYGTALTNIEVKLVLGVANENWELTQALCENIFSPIALVDAEQQRFKY